MLLLFLLPFWPSRLSELELELDESELELELDDEEDELELDDDDDELELDESFIGRTWLVASEDKS